MMNGINMTASSIPNVESGAEASAGMSIAMNQIIFTIACRISNGENLNGDHSPSIENAAIPSM